MTTRDSAPIHARRLPLLILFVLACAIRPAFAQNQPDTTGARVILSWHAPPGQPRAATALAGGCGDTTATDTLYVCFVPGLDSPTLNGFSADLRIHPAAGDSLDAYWRATTPRGELRRFQVVFAPDSMAGAATPFQAQGYGHTFSGRTADGVRLRLLFAVPGTAAAPIRAGQTYVLAKVLFHRPPRRGNACAQPLCVEWATGSLGLVMGYEPAIERGERYVGIRAPLERACAQWNRNTARPWTPAPRTP